MKNKISSVSTAINNYGCLTVVSVIENKNSTSFRCRSFPDKEKEVIELASKLLSNTDSLYDVQIIFAKQYLIKNSNIVFCWLIQVNVDKKTNMDKGFDYIINTLNNAQNSTTVQNTPKPSEEAITAQKKSYEMAVKDSFGDRRMPPPRSPGEESSLSKTKQVFKLTTVKSEVGEDGSFREEIEFPLPHITKELNVPQNPKARGAKLTSGS